jgi:hypothetical protein
VNVGVDQHGFFPVNEEEIDKLFADERDRIWNKDYTNLLKLMIKKFDL